MHILQKFTIIPDSLLSFELLMHVEHIHMTCIYTWEKLHKATFDYLYTLEIDWLQSGHWFTLVLYTVAFLWFPPLFIIVE